MERRKFIRYEEYPKGGSESTINITKDGIYKKFRPTISIYTRKRKEKMLLYLETIEELKPYYPEIRYFVEVLFATYLKGYVMKPIIGGEFDSTAYDSEEKLKALNDLKKIIELFKKYGLYYFDIRIPNILLNSNHNPILLDIDSLLFKGEKPDATPYFIKKYIARGGKIDEHAQILMFNRFTLSCFQQFDLETYIDVDKEGIEIINDSKMLDSSFDHEYLIDHIKRKIR